MHSTNLSQDIQMPYLPEQASPDPLEEPPPPLSKKDEINEALDKITQMHDELKRKLEETYEKSGWSIQEIQSYLENPSNFDTAEWEMVQQERKYLSEQVWSWVGNDAKLRAKKKEKTKEEQARKGKMLGARKNWMPMR